MQQFDEDERDDLCMNAAVSIYQNLKGNMMIRDLLDIDRDEIVQRTLDSGKNPTVKRWIANVTKEDILMATDLIISGIIERNRFKDADESWDSNLRISTRAILDTVYPRTPNMSQVLRTARSRYKSRLIAATIVAGIHGIANGWLVSLQHNKDDITFTIYPSLLMEFAKVTKVSPIVALANLYKPTKSGNQWTFHTNRTLLLDRKMNTRPAEYTLSMETIDKFLMFPLLNITPRDNRGWNYGIAHWIDRILRPAIEGKGIFKLISATRDYITIRTCEDQILLEEQAYDPQNPKYNMSIPDWMRSVSKFM